MKKISMLFVLLMLSAPLMANQSYQVGVESLKKREQSRSFSCSTRCQKWSGGSCAFRRQCIVSSDCMTSVTCERFFGSSCTSKLRSYQCGDSNSWVRCETKCLKRFGDRCEYRQKCHKKGNCLVLTTCEKFFGSRCESEVKEYICY
jgi:hypothetical protein